MVSSTLGRVILNSENPTAFHHEIKSSSQTPNVCADRFLRYVGLRPANVHQIVKDGLFGDFITVPALAAIAASIAK
jgi:hypothetical protein